MSLFRNKKLERVLSSQFLKKYLSFRSSIYGRVVMIITVSSVFLFLTISFIFRSVYEEYFNTVITQSGNNISSIVEGSLYYSMLENDKRSLKNTLDVINTMSGIDEVNMYNDRDMLVYSTFSPDTSGRRNPNCIVCHTDLAGIFTPGEKSYRIIDTRSDCAEMEIDDGSRYLMIRTPINNEKSCFTASCHAHSPDDQILGSLIIKLPLEDLDRAVDKSATEFFILGLLITLILILFLIMFTSKKIKNPLKAIIVASEAVSEGDTRTRIEIKPNLLEDMRKVSLAFNNMLDNISTATIELQNWSQQLEYKVQKKSEELSEAQNELIHVERIASLGKLSSSVAHELNNPLSGILVYTKLLQKQLANPEISATRKESMLKHLKLIETETKRCGDIVKGLLDFSRKDQENFEEAHLHEIIRSTHDLMSHTIKIADIKFTIDLYAGSDMIQCSPNQIKQACVAILVNSTEAISGNGEISIRTVNPDSKTIRIDIHDSGSGISPENIPHIFEPFFSTKHETSGIGLGLAIVHGIVQNHGGSVEVQSEPARGTTLSIILPLAGKNEM